MAVNVGLRHRFLSVVILLNTNRCWFLAVQHAGCEYGRTMVSLPAMLIAGAFGFPAA
jgi:hypothetical protein